MYRIISCLTLILLAINLNGQDTEEKKITGLWLNGGPGINDAYLIQLNMDIRSKTFLTLGYGHAYNTIGGANDPFGFAGDENFDIDYFAAMIGKQFASRRFLVRLSAGPSFASAEKRELIGTSTGIFGIVTGVYSDPVTQPGGGVHAEAKLFVIVARTTGIGFNTFFNVNTARSFAGFSVNLALGKILPR